MTAEAFQAAQQMSDYIVLAAQTMMGVSGTIAAFLITKMAIGSV
jgi:hypothetical protein